MFRNGGVSRVKRVKRVGLVIKGKSALVKGAVWIGMRKSEKERGDRERDREREEIEKEREEIERGSG